MALQLERLIETLQRGHDASTLAAKLCLRAKLVFATDTAPAHLVIRALPTDSPEAVQALFDELQRLGATAPHEYFYYG